MLWSNSTETVAFNNNFFFKDHFDEDKKREIMKKTDF